MASEHVTELFSAAVDRDLSAEQARSFRGHLDVCEACKRDYNVYRQSVDAVRALPHARMPMPVHVPAGEPAVERRGLADLVRRLPRPRLIPGGATAITAVAAAVILVLVTRGAPAPSTSSQGGGLALPQSQSHGAAAGNTAPGCTPVLSSAPPLPLPQNFQLTQSATNAFRPGERLVLAAASGKVAPGSEVTLFAQLTLPRAGAAAPGAAPSSLVQAVSPCVSVSDNNRSVIPVAQIAAGLHGDAQGADGAQSGAGTEAVTIPPGTPKGTVLYIVATVPAGFPSPGEPAFMAELTITVG